MKVLRPTLPWHSSLSPSQPAPGPHREPRGGWRRPHRLRCPEQEAEAEGLPAPAPLGSEQDATSPLGPSPVLHTTHTHALNTSNKVTTDTGNTSSGQSFRELTPSPYSHILKQTLSPSPSDREESDVLGCAAGRVQEGREVRCRGGEGGLPGAQWSMTGCRQAGESDKCGLSGRSTDAGSRRGNERREAGLLDQRLGGHREGPGQSQGTSPRSVSATTVRC